jgi:hypothetical protein
MARPDAAARAYRRVTLSPVLPGGIGASAASSMATLISQVAFRGVAQDRR